MLIAHYPESSWKKKTAVITVEEGKGLEYMFIMMNRARFDVGLLGMAIAETARQKALDYAKTRIQGIQLEI